METITIEIKNSKAYRLIEDLAALDLIRVVKTETTTKQRLSEKYASKLPTDVADELQEYVAKSRN